MDKKLFRTELRLKISGLGEDYIVLSDKGVRSMLESLPEYHVAETVFAYLSVGREVDTRAIINDALRSGKRVALPVSRPGGEMEFYLFESELSTGLFGIPEPRGTVMTEPSPGDVMLVPALCYEVGGYRMGQGGGYYDRYLSSHSAVTVGLCRELLLADKLPLEKHDVAVDVVVTEKRIARPDKGPRK